MAFKLTPAEFREKWAEALESGRFKQGRGFLTQIRKDGERYCCLGVACKLYIELGGELAREKEETTADNGKLVVVRDYADEPYTLPLIVSKALGLETTSGSLVAEHDGYESLAALNDEGKKFSAIARLIREGKVALAEGE